MAASLHDAGDTQSYHRGAMKLSSFVLGWAALLGVSFGLAYAAVPAPLLAWIGLTDLPPVALTDLRVTYGVGLTVPGLFFGLALTRPAWREPAVLGVAAMYLGLAALRSLGLVLDGSASTYHFAALAFEIPTGVLAVLASKRLASEPA